VDRGQWTVDSGLWNVDNAKLSHALRSASIYILATFSLISLIQQQMEPNFLTN